MEFNFKEMVPILSILVAVMIFIAGILIAWMKWSFKASIDLAISEEVDAAKTDIKSWMDSLERNLKTHTKDLYSDKIDQAGTSKDIERLQGDIKELKKDRDDMRKTIAEIKR